MSKYASLLIAAILSGGACTLLEDADAQPDNITWEKVLRVWKERQNDVRSLKFSWTERITRPKGSILSPLMRERNPKGATVPPDDFTYETLVTMLVDGDKMRYSFEGQDWVPEKERFVKQEYISSFDGAQSRALWPPGVAAWAQGTILPEKHSTDANNLHVRPVLMTYRALHANMGILDAKTLYKVSAQGQMMRGVRCALVEGVQQDASGALTRMWVDPERGFCIVRYIVGLPEKPEIQIDVEYTQDAERRPVPKRWDFVWMNLNGGIKLSSTADVTDYALNTSFQHDEFHLDFPSGTRVIDRSVKPTRNYIVRTDGERVILPEEMAATHEQLVNSEPGKAFEHKRSGFWVSAVALAVLLIVISVVFVAVRRRRS